jgi:DNA repair photolyase
VSWNPVTGCLHGCSYCWARRLALTRLKRHLHYALHGFNPAFNERALARRFKPGEWVFVSDMGDLWGSWVPSRWIERVLEVVRANPRTEFFFLTKNPIRYFEFLDRMPENATLGATVETNRDEGYEQISRAPKPSERLEAMAELDWPRKVIVVEPVLDFDLEEFAEAVKRVGPAEVYIGYDNYGCKLPEPPLAKVKTLISRLEGLTRVHSKSLRPAWYENP